ncbi:M17 family metallopeptidase [Aliikangiella sp. IMCC44653]
MGFPKLHCNSDKSAFLNSNQANDCVILVSPNAHCESSAEISAVIEKAAKIDQRIGKEALLVGAEALSGARLVYAAVGPIERDYDDVRNFGDAAAQGVLIAKNAGAKNPIIIVEGAPQDSVFKNALEVAYLSACQALWQPLEARQAGNETELEPVNSITLFDPKGEVDVNFLTAVEAGRRLARDLAGTEPEQFAPPGFADYCKDAFAGTSVTTEVIADYSIIEKEYPLLAAVARCSNQVERHQPRVVNLTYQPEGPIQKTLFLVGKAVTYDTGGADVKTGGHMAGMSRDKGGAAAVAGFVKTIAELKPKGIKVVASLGVVRNSIGANAFVADEIITSHAGVRVRIGNTDAEGRLVMADLLSHSRVQALKETAPELMTVATLTGHAALAAGPYTIMIENGPARDIQMANKLEQAGESWGDGVEVGRSRREDWNMIKPRTAADDVLSSNNGPSVSVARGHQFPMAFLALSSGLDQHGSRTESPLPYTHIDIAGSGVEGSDWQHGKPTGAPLVALAARYLRA